jgi:hypothetical protein
MKQAKIFLGIAKFLSRKRRTFDTPDVELSPVAMYRWKKQNKHTYLTKSYSV